MENFDDLDDIEFNLKKELEELRRQIDKGYDSCLKNPVTHDKRQIKSLDDLEAGKTYLGMNSEFGKVGKFRVLSTMPRNGWLDVKLIFPDKEFEYQMSLADYGLVPYKNLKWNPTNYVIPAEEK